MKNKFRDKLRKAKNYALTGALTGGIILGSSIPILAQPQDQKEEEYIVSNQPTQVEKRIQELPYEKGNFLKRGLHPYLNIEQAYEAAKAGENHIKVGIKGFGEGKLTENSSLTSLTDFYVDVENDFQNNLSVDFNLKQGLGYGIELGNSTFNLSFIGSVENLNESLDPKGGLESRVLLNSKGNSEEIWTEGYITLNSDLVNFIKTFKESHKPIDVNSKIGFGVGARRKSEIGDLVFSLKPRFSGNYTEWKRDGDFHLFPEDLDLEAEGSLRFNDLFNLLDVYGTLTGALDMYTDELEFKKGEIGFEIEG